MMYLNGLVHSGLPQSQEKIEVFENKSGNLTKLKKKNSDIVSLNLQNSLFSRAVKW